MAHTVYFQVLDVLLLLIRLIPTSFERTNPDDIYSNTVHLILKVGIFIDCGESS